MRPSKTRRASIAATGAALLLLGSQAAASAAQSFDISTNMADGGARAYGSVTFVDANTVKVTSSIADICSSSGAGDGEGAYLWFQIQYTDGTYDGGRSLNINFDNDGCGNGYQTRSSTFNPGRNIAWVRLRLDESNGPSGTSSDTVYSTQKDNPYT